jgi:predicted MFS family arabinose efflux permease
VILVTMPRRPIRQEHSIDWLGAAVLAGGTTALLLGLVWGGNEYPWGSPAVVGALLAAAILIAAFGLIERRVVEPIIPFDLLRNQTVASSVACMALVGAAMFGTISFVPLFVQGVIGTSATSSGVVLTPLILGAVTTSFISGQIVSRTGRYRPNTLIGPVVLGAGMVLLWRMGIHTTNGEAARNMVIAGIGLGMMMQIFVLSVQNSVPRAAMGTATALTQFSRSIGATLGVTLMGVIVNQNLPSGLQTSGVAIHRLPLAGRVALAHALRPAFLLAAFLCAAVFVISLLWVREAPLRTGLEDVAVGDEASAQRGTRAAAR